jgi:hypothetical protein
MGQFIQKATISMSGSASETAITLLRGTGQFIREIRAYFPNAVAGDYIQFFRKDTATTANQKDASNAASNQVLLGEGYFFNGDLVFSDMEITNNLRDAQLRTEALRVYISSSQSGTVYLNVLYEYN